METVWVGFDGCGRDPSWDFDLKLKDFNHSQGTPHVACIWNPTCRLVSIVRTSRDGLGRKGLVVDGIYMPGWDVGVVLDGLPPSYYSEGKYLSNGFFFFRVFDWLEPLDDRVFEFLHLADTANGRGIATPIERIEARERLKEQEQKKDNLMRAYAVTEHFAGYDNLTVGPGTRGNWRHRIR